LQLPQSCGHEWQSSGGAQRRSPQQLPQSWGHVLQSSGGLHFPSPHDPPPCGDDVDAASVEGAATSKPIAAKNAANPSFFIAILRSLQVAA